MKERFLTADSVNNQLNELKRHVNKMGVEERSAFKYMHLNDISTAHVEYMRANTAANLKYLSGLIEGAMLDIEINESMKATANAK